jgi:hypothetical protein
VAQSKTAAGLEEIGEVQGVNGSGNVVPRQEVKTGQLATWNHISRRLSKATFGPV